MTIVSTMAVFDRSTGKIAYLAPEGHKPADASLATASLPADFDSATWKWDATTRAMIEDPARLEAQLIAEVKARAETAKMAAITRGFGKSEEYKRKASEAAASASLVAATINALSAADALVRFPAAWHEALLGGEKLAAVLARYRASTAAALGVIDRMSAIEQVAVARIKAAPSVANKRAAAAAIDWSWKPA